MEKKTRGSRHLAWSTIKEMFAGFSEHKITKLSGSLAYYTVFSMGPLLVVIISMCGLFFKKEAVENRIYTVMKDFIGADTAAQLQEIIRNAGTGGKGVLAAVISIVVLLVGATTVFAEIQDSINTIWGLKPKPKKGWVQFIRNRILSFSVVIGLGFLLLVSLSFSGIIEVLSERLRSAYPDTTIAVFYIGNLALSLLISTLIFAVIFKVLPDARIRWKDVFAGAAMTAVLFIIGKFGISFYIAKTQVGSTYGAAGSLVILIVWIYYSSIILYLGAEFTKSWALHYGAEIVPNAYAVTTQLQEVEKGKTPVQKTGG